MTTTAQRDTLCELMDYLYEYRDRVHYPPIVHGQIIRQQTVHEITSPAALRARVMSSAGAVWDCSQTVYALMGAAGLHRTHPDGATGTLLEDLRGYSDARAAYPGALAVFGPGSGHHVVMVRHRDTIHGNPVVFSMGQESDPRYLSLLTEAAGQPAPIRMLSIAHL
jgi:hypothetical protein